MSNIRTIKDIKREEEQANLVSEVANTALSAIGGGWSLASRYWNKMTSDEGRRSAQRQGEALNKFVSEAPQKLGSALWPQEQKSECIRICVVVVRLMFG
ncbi:hypothetical protein NpNSSI1_00008479 [Neofusicoccum parvum]|uniref:Uncharacterized protein n=1 Tax=Neofusicoccum parvum TaxID=310453 RepID=A0ACB5SNC2_9PEZI|nr:hypothetical protein NpNSSI1_00008479 [Neofusicoccum parvum]GME49611.1 hypothetical protein NpPPO83_00005023 [Neofusicoccum parvum]